MVSRVELPPDVLVPPTVVGSLPGLSGIGQHPAAKLTNWLRMDPDERWIAAYTVLAAVGKEVSLPMMADVAVAFVAAVGDTRRMTALLLSLDDEALVLVLRAVLSVRNPELLAWYDALLAGAGNAAVPAPEASIVDAEFEPIDPPTPTPSPESV